MLTFTIEKPKEVSFEIPNVDLGADAFDRGYEAGEKDGYLNGYEIGAKEGAEVGYAKGEQEGYKKGVAEVEAQNAEILTDCNAQLESKGVEGAESLEQVPQRIGEIDKRGALQYSTAAKFPYLNLFGKKEIEIYMPLLSDAQEMFVPANEANNTVEHITLIGGDTATLRHCNAMFNMNWRGGPLKHITFDIDFSKVTHITNLFNNHSGVVTIDGKPLDFSSITESLNFSYMSSLEHIRFAPGTMKRNLSMHSCEKLSDGSIQSVIESLQDLTGQATKTLTFHQSVGDKLTPAQKATITAKNWTLVY